MLIDVRVMELLASKLCHDLVSPVSAINNGVELIEDIGGTVVDEAMKLIGDSANAAARRLRLYRMAYGRAGTDESLSPRDVRQVAEQYLLGGKVSLIWGDDALPASLTEQRGFLKTLLNVVVLSEELLAYGGVVTLRAAEGDVPGCRFEVVGRNAQLNPVMLEAFDGSVDVNDLTPRGIQAYVCGRFAENFGLRLTHAQPAPDRLDLLLYEAVPAAIAAESHAATPIAEAFSRSAQAS